jgi:hypothetical protein
MVYTSRDRRPLQDDWVQVHSDLQFSAKSQLYWVPSTRKVYDTLSANHNGIIGVGALLRNIIKKETRNAPSNA